MNLRFHFSFGHAFVAGCFAVCVVHADQTNLNEQPYRLGTVVVSGEAENAPPVGASVSVLSGATLEQHGITSPRELTAITPNLATFDANGDRTPRFSLRGLRENNFSYGESAVGIYVDDVPYSDLYTRGVPLFDIYSGEFYRGPQPTLFGANRPGGVLNLMTRLPGNDWHGRGAVSYGNYNAVSLDGGVGGPVVKDNLFFGVSGLYSRRDGFADNQVTGNDVDRHETFAGRAQVRWTPTETLDFTASVVADHFSDGGVIVRPINASGDPFKERYDQDGFNHQSSQTYALRGAWTGESVQAVSITSWRTWRQDLAGDFDFLEFTFPGSLPAIQGFAKPKVQQWSQEFRLQSVDQDAALKWNAGAYWSQLSTDYASGQNFGPFAPIFISPFLSAGDSDTTSGRNRVNDLALFGQATYTIGEKLDLTAGLRFEYVDVDGSRNHTQVFGGFPVVNARSYGDNFRSLQPRAGLAYHFTPDIMAWANFTTGFQPGGFNPSSDNPALAGYHRAESLHYEIGASAKLLDGKLIASASGFWIDTHDYHTYRFVGPGPTDFSILNAEQERTIGGELELRALPCEFFEFRLAAGYQHAEYLDFTTPAPTSQNLDGKRVSFVPDITIDASVTARTKCGFFATVGVTAVGDYWFDDANTVKQEAFALLYARAGWQGKNFGVSVFGRNLADRRYFANALDLGGGFMVGTPGDPQTYGVELSARF